MKYIPKKVRVKTTLFKNILVSDVVMLIPFLFLAGIILGSNIEPLKWILLAINIIVGAVVLFPFGHRRGYQLAKDIFLFKVAKKKYQQNTASPVSNLFNYKFEDGYIYDGKAFGQMLQIETIEFFLLTVEQQELIINEISTALKQIQTNVKLQLIKINRPVLLDNLRAVLESKIAKIPQKISGQNELIPRQSVLEDRLAVVDDLNESEFMIIPHFYLCAWQSAKTVLDDAVEKLKKYFASVKLNELNCDEMQEVLKYYYNPDYDERICTAKNDSLLKNEKQANKKACNKNGIETLCKEESSNAICVEEKEKEDFKFDYLPRSIEFKKKSIVINDVEMKQVAISEYPLEVPNAWAYDFFNTDKTTVCMNVLKQNKETSKKLLNSAIKEIGSQTLASGGNATENLQKDTHIETLNVLLADVLNGNEHLFDVQTIFRASDDEAFQSLSADGFSVRGLSFEQEKMFMNSLIGSSDGDSIYKNQINSLPLASAVPFISSRCIDDNGIIIGDNGLPVSLDFFKTDEIHLNGNMFVVGSIGSGKSFFIKTLISNLASEGVDIDILDPENEYDVLAKNFGGKVIDMSSSATKFNLLHMFPALEDENCEETIKPFSSQMQFVEAFFDNIFPTMTLFVKEKLLKIIMKIYKEKYNIDENTENVELLRKVSKDFPTFDDVHELAQKEFKQYKMENETFEIGIYRELLIYTEKLALGTFSSSWNGHNSFDTKNHFRVFNFRRLLANNNKHFAIGQMLLLTHFLFGKMIEAHEFLKTTGVKKKFAIIIDEAHCFVDEENPIALKFLKDVAKRIRKCGGILILTSQSISDFLGTPQLEKSSKAVLTEIQYNLTLHLQDSAMPSYLELFKTANLTPFEIDSIKFAQRGQGLLKLNSKSRIISQTAVTEFVQAMFEEKNFFDENLKELA